MSCGPDRPRRRRGAAGAPLSRLRRALGDGRLQGRGDCGSCSATARRSTGRSHTTRSAARVRRSTAGTRPARWRRPTRWSGSPRAGCCRELEAREVDVRRAELGDLRLDALALRAAGGIRLGSAALPEAERAARAAVERRRSRNRRAPRDRGARGARNQAEALRAFEDARALLREDSAPPPGRRWWRCRAAAAEEPFVAAPIAVPAPSGWSSATRSSRCSPGWRARGGGAGNGAHLLAGGSRRGRGGGAGSGPRCCPRARRTRGWPGRRAALLRVVRRRGPRGARGAPALADAAGRRSARR